MADLSMPELSLHFAVPFGLTVPFLGLRRAVIVSLIALLPDLDVLLHVHRSASHSFVVLGAISLIAIGLVRAVKFDVLPFVSVACLALLSHPVMDVFSTYTPILYPLLGESIYLSVEAGALIESHVQPRWDVGVSTEPTSFKGFQRMDAPLFTSEGFAVSLMLVAVPILVIISKDLRARWAGRAGKSSHGWGSWLRVMNAREAFVQDEVAPQLGDPRDSFERMLCD